MSRQECSQAAMSASSTDSARGWSRPWFWLRVSLILNAIAVLTIASLAYSLWQPEGELVLIKVTPSGQVLPERVDHILVEFGAPLAAESVHADAMRIVPSVPGRLERVGVRQLKYVLHEPLTKATRYRLDFSPALRGVQGEHLSEVHPTFSTPRLCVESVTQARVEADGAVSLAVRFNGMVNPRALQESLRLKQRDKQTVSFSVAGAQPAARLEVHVPQLEQDWLKFTIDKGLTGIDGPLGLADAYEAELHVLVGRSAPPPPPLPPAAGSQAARTGVPHVITITPTLRFLGMRTVEGYRDREILIRTNDPLDARQAEAFITIDPDLPHTVAASADGLRIQGDFRPGLRYRVTLGKGMPAGSGGKLHRTYTRAVWFSDQRPSFRFAFGSGYLSPQGLLQVPIRSVNMKAVRLRVVKLYASNLVEHVLTGPQGVASERASVLRTRDLMLAKKPNQEVETLLDLRDVAEEEPLGVYGLRLRDPERCWSYDHATIVVTDLGLSVRLAKARAFCWVASLATGKPVQGAYVAIYSDRRQRLGMEQTGTDGVCDIDLQACPAGEKPALAIVAKGRDLSYLDFSSNTRSRGQAASQGRAYLQQGYEAFAASDRGVYRPGDTVRLSALVRGSAMRTPTPMPLDLVVQRPDGRTLCREAVMCDEAGRISTRFLVPMAAPSGHYPVSLRLPGSKHPLGQTSFRVADYIPQTLRLALSIPKEPLPAKGGLTVNASVKHLFGDPAGGLKVKCRVSYRSCEFTPLAWKGFRFGDRRVSPARRSGQEQTSTTDAQGKVRFSLDAPDMESGAAIEARIEVEAQEKGGRALVESASRRLDPWLFYLGVQTPEAAIYPRESTAFDLVAVTPASQGYTQAKAWKATLLHVTYSNVLRRVEQGRLRYEWTRSEAEEATLAGRFAGSGAQVQFAPQRPGAYRLVVEAEGGCPVVCDFNVLGYGATWARKDPEALQLSLDRARYQPGDEAKVVINAPFGGTALVCVESDRVLAHRVVVLPKGEGSLQFTVKDTWRPNIYVTAALIRPVRAEDDWQPHRTSGVVRLDVDCADKRLVTRIDTPQRVRPGKPMTVRVQVQTPAGAPAANAAVVFAAVDQGVLGLTSFRTPSPWDFFYARRRLDVQEIDMYSRLAPELARWQVGKEADPGGGGYGSRTADLARRLNPIQAKRVKTALLYAGELFTNAQGVAETVFTVPEYVGELRLMAFAANQDCFGSDEKPLPVKSPVMFRASWPRFLAPGDRALVPVTLFNRTGTDGEIELLGTFDGPLDAEESLPLGVSVPAGKEKTVWLNVTAAQVGKAKARLTVRLGDESYGESVELAVRPPVAFDRRGGMVQVPAGEERFVTIPAAFIPATTKTRVVISGNPAIELAGSLSYLLQYPYGCVEQTTSRLVPLVYLRDLAELMEPGSVGAEEVDALMQAGFLRLRMMQTCSGGLAMWPHGETPYDWGTIYATDLLVEADKAGYDVPTSLLEPALRFIQQRLEHWVTTRSAAGHPLYFGEAAYGCYVLTRAGRRPHTWLARLEEILRKGHDGQWRIAATARHHVAAAYLAAGERKAAQELAALPARATTTRQRSGYLDSPIREAAIQLLTCLDVAPKSPRIPVLVQRLRRGLNQGRWCTTQENAFALMALGKYARRMPVDRVGEATLVLPGGTQRTFRAATGYTLKRLEPGQSALVRAPASSCVQAFWQAEGVPLDGQVVESDAGFSIRRRLCAAKGSESMALKELKQGDLYQVVLWLSSAQPIENLVVTDLLPAGLEIESLSLGHAARLEPAKGVELLQPIHVEPRDDRMLLFADLPEGVHEYRYLVRAVTAGAFVQPAVEASCMYDPSLFSIHGKGMIEVTR